ncbi:hypothetical protein TNCV_199711 [Trichonephila clavipes]|nr:hypothetical protein TNCV_199711 [Trichonephila clavipes]
MLDICKKTVYFRKRRRNGYMSEFDSRRVVADQESGLSSHDIAIRIDPNSTNVFRKRNRRVQENRTAFYACFQQFPDTYARKDRYFVNSRLQDCTDRSRTLRQEVGLFSTQIFTRPVLSNSREPTPMKSEGAWTVIGNLTLDCH